MQAHNAIYYPPPRYKHFPPIIITGDERLLEIDDTARIDSFVKIEVGKGVQIGKWVHIASFAHINIGAGCVILMEGSAVASGGRVIGGTARPEGISMSAAAPPDMLLVDRRHTTIIGRNAVVGVNAVVLPGITLGDGAILAAGGVATKDIPPHEIWAGTPAKFIRKREYEKIPTDLSPNG